MNLFQGNILFPSYVYSPINGVGGGGCILAIPVTVVQPRFVNGGKARERGEGVGGGFPTVGKFFKICV